MYAILATITPKAGSLQKVTDLVKAIGKYAEDHEPECVEFRLCMEVDPEGIEAIHTIEKFNTLSGLRTHQTTPALADFYKITADQDLLEKETVVRIVKGVYGYHV
ncbi:hypothetical protein Trihar35433_11134 [Trichoderma harzianum]|nr:hypothetical protein Trihar35433_11134 [Trichoderma harzianum]